jgi:integrase
MAGVRRKVRILRRRERGAGEPAKAMSAEQLAAFLETARTRRPAFYPLALLLARSGLRLGEALALRWTDIDLVTRTIRVERTLGHTVKGFPTDGPPIGTPKSGRARTVDMSQALSRVLTSRLREHRAEALRRGDGQALGWLFPAPSGRLQRDGEARDEFARVLRWAGLPGHFTPHCLRHTFAVQLIQRNAPLSYVQAQLGHASIQMTVDVYGRWLPTGDRALIDQLDAEQGSQEAAERRRAAAGGRDRNATISTDAEILPPEVIAFIGTSATDLAAVCITPD